MTAVCHSIMAGLVPAIHVLFPSKDVLFSRKEEDVDARAKRAHDEHRELDR